MKSSKPDANRIEAFKIIEERLFTRLLSAIFAQEFPEQLLQLAVKNKLHNKIINKDSLLHHASKANNLQVLAYLLIQHADPNLVEPIFGNTPLQWAIANTQGEAAIKLIILGSQYNIDLNIKDDQGKTALHMAVIKGWFHKDDANISQVPMSDIIQTLLDYNADVNSQDKHGNTALHYAIMHRNTDCIKALLNKNIDLSIKNHDGKTAYDLLKMKFEDVSVFLKGQINPLTLMTTNAWENNKAAIVEIFNKNKSSTELSKQSFLSHKDEKEAKSAVAKSSLKSAGKL